MLMNYICFGGHLVIENVGETHKDYKETDYYRYTKRYIFGCYLSSLV